MPAPIAMGFGVALKLLDVLIAQNAFSASYMPQAVTFAGKIREAIRTGQPLDPVYVAEQEAALSAEINRLHARADEAREEIARRKAEET